MDLIERFKPTRELLRKEIERSLKDIPEPIRTRLSEYVLKSSGKMLRPMMILEISRILTGSPDSGMHHAKITELLHNMSLIHDDIADWAPLRRGHEAYHIKWGIERAVLDGDVLLTFALNQLDENTREIIMKTVYSIAVGNALEVEYRLKSSFEFTPQKALEIMRLKTADVFRVALEIACVAAGEPTEFGKEFGEFAIHAGLAFQIQDDFLDIYTSHKDWGKKQLWDIQESKRNLFLAHGLQLPDPDGQRLIEIYSKPVGKKTEDDLKEVVSIFAKVMPQIEEERDQQIATAIAELDKVRERLKDHPRIEELCDFFEAFAALLTFREL
ncbi:MAG: polyprenyl synthetase family protein [Candidatus Hodarchaeales archaeon]|jgi:geranylgeranyl diphosphate synthase type II